MKIDITSLVLVLLILCMIYYNRREGYDNVYEYREFSTENVAKSTKKYFNMLLDPMDIKKKYIYTVYLIVYRMMVNIKVRVMYIY